MLPESKIHSNLYTRQQSTFVFFCYQFETPVAPAAEAVFQYHEG